MAGSVRPTATCVDCGTTGLPVPGSSTTLYIPARDIAVYRYRISQGQFPPVSVRFFTCRACSSNPRYTHYFGVTDDQAQLVGRVSSGLRHGTCRYCGDYGDVVDQYCSV